jgi:DNA polymerase iota
LGLGAPATPWDVMNAATATILARNDERIIIHADHDNFYAQTFEVADPALRGLPLAVQQKHIIVTCNYEARRRGLHKLQLISEAKKLCPDVVIVSGEQLDRFRDASKDLYKYLEGFTWNKKVERLGFDEVFMDITDIISYNQALLNGNDLEHAFFHLSCDDPTIGFSFDATMAVGHQYPEASDQLALPQIVRSSLLTRLILGSHLAQHVRHKLEEEKGYTSTFGISTSKLLSKLVGNLHKPRSQTTLMPPYESLLHQNGMSPMLDGLSTLHPLRISNVTTFIDSHDIGKIPGIGFKMSQKIRCYVLSRPAQFDDGLIYGGTKESITVGDVRRHPGMGPEVLEKILGGPGSERGIGFKTWGLINGIGDSEVKTIRKVPNQISIEDSYVRLDTTAQVYEELRMLCTTLLKRMRVDLLDNDADDEGLNGGDLPRAANPELGSPVILTPNKRWIAHPKTIRLTTRPRPPLKPDGTRSRKFNRISRSGPLPNFVFNLHEGIDVLVEKLVQEILGPMFHKLHPEKQGWNLSLMNVGVTNMVEAASEDGSGGGRDIGRMFKRQEEALKEWKVEDKDVPPDTITEPNVKIATSDESDLEIQAESSAGNDAMENILEDAQRAGQNTMDEEDVEWEDKESDVSCRCHTCGAGIPAFAVAAHQLYHDLGD